MTCWRRPIAGLTPILRSRRQRRDEFEALDLYHATSGGEAALARKYRNDAIREGTHTAIRQSPATSRAI